MFDLLSLIKRILGISYSQEGEDLILSRIFKNRKYGFYVDVGAHHPTRFSNTHLFYKKGWRGINIDATPGSMEAFDLKRPRDINIECPVGNINNKINYYIFDEPALNSFSSKLSKGRDSYTKYKIREIVKLKPQRLVEILDKKLPANTKIDFMSVDVEGLEYNVLVSNDWKKYRPDYLLVEILEKNSGLMKNKVYTLLENHGYKIKTRTGRTVIFKKVNEN